MLLTEQQFTQVIQTVQNVPKRITINKNDVTLNFLLARDIGKTFKIVYTVSILTKYQRYDPNFVLSPVKIDMVSLKRAILNNILNYDLKYVKLVKFDHKLAEFHFDVDKWLEDCTRNIRPRTEFSKFSRTFRFRTRLPSMILQIPLNAFFDDFLIRKFKEFMDNKKKAAKWFKYLVPESLRKRARIRISNMFEYSYDMQWNVLTLTLKTIYILALIYAIGVTTKKLTKADISGQFKQQQFAKSVKAKIVRFDRTKWEKFVHTGRV